jgi:3-deoxy-D-manno-octulosonic-acid transferase
MRTLYNLALLPLRAAAVLYGAWPRGSAEAALERDQRLGRRLPRVPASSLWIHGASVGEARLVGLIARAVRERRPGQTLIVSAVTPTGRVQLPAPPLAEASFFHPLDFPAVQRRTFDALAPSAVVLVETELWPNMLAEAEDRGIPVVVVSARLAPERLTRYRRFDGLYRPLARGLAAVGAGSAEEADRFVALGVPEERVSVTGSLKFEVPAPAVSASELRARHGVPDGRLVLAAGSTGSGEDPLVLDAYDAVRRRHPETLLILAPRHPDRFDTAAGEAGRRRLRVARVTRQESASEADVLIVDTIGQLASLYGLAHAAFVGGTLVPVGGHNLLEPAAADAPVLFGPHTGHVEELARALIDSGAGERVADATALGAAWIRLLEEPNERRRRIVAGRALLEANRGALARSVDLILDARDRAGRAS